MYALEPILWLVRLNASGLTIRSVIKICQVYLHTANAALQRLNIVCANDATVAALFDVYAEYINTEQGGAREAYEVNSNPLFRFKCLFNSLTGFEA